MGRRIEEVTAIEPYASVLGTDNFPIDPDPIYRSMQTWPQELRRGRPKPRHKGKFVQY